MKKLLLSCLALTVCLSAVAQNGNREVQSKLNSQIKSKSLKVTKPSDGPLAPIQQVNPTTSQSRSSMTETSLGQTQYDLQSNYGSVGNRVHLWDDNTISAIWTKGDLPTSFSDRGTGYNYYNGTSWGAAPTARIETYRTGFPNISGTGSGAEYVVNHGTNPTNLISRASKGTGAWAEGAAGTVGVTWPRMVVGGANGQTIHVIGNENAGSLYVTYSRSLDGGATWVDINTVLPNFAQYHFEGSVDAYDIDSRGDVVAIILGGFSESLTLWKSLDNGSTWTTTVINQFPLAPWDYNTSISDVDGDGVADTIPTTDSGMSLVIDNNNVCHVAVGSTRVLCTASPDVSYFPGTDGLLYWNETMPAGNILNNFVAAIEDIDGNGTIDFLAPDIAPYQCGLSGMPTLGVDGQNNIHLAYSSIIENTTNSSGTAGCEESFRNVYYMYSTDMGANWSNPSRVEPSDFDEMVWPNMAKRVNNCVHLTYHKDGEPGNAFQPNPSCDVAGVYDIIYTCITNPVGINEINTVVGGINVYPNPAVSVFNVEYTLPQSQKVTIQLVDVLGKVVYTVDQNGTDGVNNMKINVKNYASGMYSLNIKTGNNIKTQKVIIQ
jgi:hypothetical protein